MQRVSLSQQIEEVEREIALRVTTYERLVKSGAMRQSIADFHLGRMRAVFASLVWLRDHQQLIKQRIGEAA